MSLARPADRIRARALRARAARCPWSAGATRMGEPAGPSRPAVAFAEGRGPAAGPLAREPDPETGPSEST
jgi:hypothetical protein